MELSEQDVEDGLKVLEKYCQQTYGIELDDEELCKDIVSDGSLMADLEMAPAGGDAVGTTAQAETDAPAEVLQAVKSYWRWLMFIYERLGLKHIVLIGLVGAYAGVGGLVFHVIEAPHETRLLATARRAAADRHQRFAGLLADVARGRQCSRRSTACEAAMRPMLSTYDDETGLAEQQRAGVWRWDYFNAVFYSATIFTTIGYGHMACRTDLGRAVTMLYALVGIPLTLLLLKNIGGLIFTWADRGWKSSMRYLKIRAQKLRRKRREAGRTEPGARRPGADDDESSTLAPSFHDTFPLPLVLAIVVLYSVFCSMLFTVWGERWDYFTGFYFFFISITTIGLGDEMPEYPSYALGFLFFFMVGLALLSMCVSVLHSRLEAKYMAALHLIDLRTRARPIVLPQTVADVAAILQPDADGEAVLANLGLPLVLEDEAPAPTTQTAESGTPPEERDGDPLCPPAEQTEVSLSTAPLTQVVPPAVLGVLMAGRRQQRRDQLAGGASTARTSGRSSLAGSMAVLPVVMPAPGDTGDGGTSRTLAPNDRSPSPHTPGVVSGGASLERPTADGDGTTSGGRRRSLKGRLLPVPDGLPAVERLDLAVLAEDAEQGSPV